MLSIKQNIFEKAYTTAIARNNQLGAKIKMVNWGLLCGTHRR
ncbi:hypothetical protein [Tychonema sp. LEGE 06208]|nr:hypothetical protein [Tychonema sp. LEGE 06208]